MANALEKGDIYFFYRNKVNVEQAKSREDVQRFYMMLAPDSAPRARLFVVGKKRMPEILPGKSSSREREWMMTGDVAKPEKLAEGLKPVRYSTRTRGEQLQSEAIPVGEGRYSLVCKDGSTRLAYRLSAPEKPGKAQRELGINAEASYLMSIRNPEMKVPGFPKEKPKYPKYLKERFADERWLPVEEPKLLDYKNVQVVLIGAEKKVNARAAGISGKSKLFKRLGLDRADWPTEALQKGEFAKPTSKPPARGPSSDPSKGGRRGGRKASTTASSAGVAKALKGVEFPCKRQGLIRHAENSGADKEVVKLLKQCRSGSYENMADVQKAVAEVR